MSSPKAQRPIHKPSHKALRELDRLERSSPRFPDQLARLLSREGLERYSFSRSLVSGDVAWLIEYLDNALDTLDPVDIAHRKCLEALQWACYTTGTLPPLYILDVSSFVPIASPASIWPYEIIYEGSINGSKVCAKKLNPLISSRWSNIKKHGLRQIVKWKHLMHPNILPFLGITNEPMHFVSARAPGAELNEYITDHPNTNRLELLIGVANGLNYLHFLHVVHGDLGGPNIIVNDSGHPRITEYGLAGLFWPQLTTRHLRCRRWADPRRSSSLEEFDVFSFAMVMLEVFTGEVPFFPAPDSVALSALERGELPERPAHMDLTAKLWALIERCWDKSISKRPKMSEVSGILHDCRDDDRGLAPVLPPESSDWLSQITNEILDLTDQVASVALFGPMGAGKSFVARSVLDNDRTKAKFGEHRYFICCDGLEDSLGDFIQHLSGATHADDTRFKSHLQSTSPLILLLDSVDSLLGPLAPEAEEIYAMMEEFGSYENVCLVTTSRMYPDIHGFHRVEVPTPTEGGARDIFYSICNLARSPTVDTLIAKLDFHPFSIELFARTIRENGWDEQELSKMWGDPKGALRTTYYESLKNAIEPVFRSPKMKELGTASRDVLEAIASFPSGIKEHQLEGIFRGTGGVREVVDVLCRFSLVYRRNGVLKMLSPFQFYFLESTIVYAETEEVIKWGPDCMPAKAWLPVYTQGPPEGWLTNATSGPTIRQDADSLRPCGGPSNATPDAGVPRRRKWIRRLPQIVKRRLLALFGRRVAPTILIEMQGGSPNIPPTVLQETPTHTLTTAAQEGHANVLPTIAEDPGNTPPAASREDVTDTPPYAPQQQVEPAPVAYDMD